jgi:hypothetical protein
MDSSSKVDVAGFSAQLNRLKLPMGLTVDVVRISGNSASLTTDPVEFSLEDWGAIEAEVAAADLADFLTTQAPSSLKDFDVAIANGFIDVTATAKVIVELRATAKCYLSIRGGGKQLFVELDSVDGLAMAKGMIQGQLDQINPVLDAAQLPLEVVFENASAQEGKITLRGKARPKPAG